MIIKHSTIPLAALVAVAILSALVRADQPEPVSSGLESTKLTIPDAQAREKTRAKIHTIFRIDEAKEPKAKRRLALQMLRVGKQEQDDATALFVLSNLARELALECEDTDLALAAIEQLHSRFQMDRLKERARILYQATHWKLPAAKERAVAEKTLELIDESIGANRLELSEPLAKRLALKAKNYRDFDLRSRIIRQRKRVLSLSQKWAKVKPAADTLEVAPDNVNANLRYGKYLCFSIGDWESGLPHLAKGNDVVLKELAQRDLAGPQKVQQQLKLADDWYRTSKMQDDYASCKQRARHWYQQVHGRVDGGITRLTVERRLQEIRRATPQRNGSNGVPRRAESIPSQLPVGTTVLLTFEPDTCLQRNKTHIVANLAGRSGHLMGDFVPVEGKVGQAIRFNANGAELHHHQFARATQGSMAMWARIGELKGGERSSFVEYSSHPIFSVFVNSSRQLVVQSWHPQHDWTTVATPHDSVPENDWTFLAFAMWGCTDEGGRVRLHVDDKMWEFPFRMCGHKKPQTSKILLGEGNMLDEFILSVLPYSADQFESLRQLGLNGRGFGRPK